jgi:spore coat polysaccharide biosynthesis predicted glycosyltransferase SpsG
MTNVVLVTEGSEQVGMGHLYRTATVINQLADKATCHVRAITPRTVKTPIGKERISSYRCVSELDEIRSVTSPESLVIDVPESHDDDELFQLIKRIEPNQIVAFGHWYDDDHPLFVSLVDVVVDFVADGGSFVNGRRRIRNTIYLEGPRYLILRKEFYDWKNYWSPKPQPETIIVLFGGTDPQDHTFSVTHLLLKQTEYQIKPVFGPENSSVDKFLKKFGEYDRVNPIINPNSVAERLASEDLLITSPGLTMYEALYIGLPVVAFAQNKLQQKIYDGHHLVYDISNSYKLYEIIQESYERTRSEEYTIEIGTGLSEILYYIHH